MFKFIIFCAVASLCVARSVNDKNAPPVVAAGGGEKAVQVKAIAVDDIVDESVQSLLANIESIDHGEHTEEGADKLKGLFGGRFRSTTVKPFLAFTLFLNPNALNNSTSAMVNTSA